MRVVCLFVPHKACRSSPVSWRQHSAALRTAVVVVQHAGARVLLSGPAVVTVECVSVAVHVDVTYSSISTALLCCRCISRLQGRMHHPRWWVGATGMRDSCAFLGVGGWGAHRHGHKGVQALQVRQHWELLSQRCSARLSISTPTAATSGCSPKPT